MDEINEQHIQEFGLLLRKKMEVHFEICKMLELLSFQLPEINFIILKKLCGDIFILCRNLYY